MFRRKLTDEEVMYMYKMNEILGNPHISGVTKQVTKLMPHMYIGGQHNAESLNTLRTLNITYVLNCGAHPKQKGSPYEGLGIEYHQFIATDDDNYNISQHFGESFKFIDKAKRKGAKILVHCAMGINRSGAVSAAYLMKERRMTLLETMKFLKASRIVTLTNIGFRLQLIHFAKFQGVLDPIDVIKREIEESFGRENQMNESSRRNEKSEKHIMISANPPRDNRTFERKIWRPIEYIPTKYRVNKADEIIDKVEKPPHEETVYSPRFAPAPTTYNPPAYRPREFEDYTQSYSGGPIIDPELLAPDRPTYTQRSSYRDSFVASPSIDRFRSGPQVRVGRRHSIAPSLRYYDTVGRYLDSVERQCLK